MSYRDSAKPLEYVRSKLGDAFVLLVDLATDFGTMLPIAMVVTVVSVIAAGFYCNDRHDWCEANGGEPVGMWTGCVKPPEPQRCRRYRESTEHGESWHCTNEVSQ